MASPITSIPTTRVSDLFVRQRMLGQLQYDQQELFRAQTQISTGRRILTPSDDAPAALRAQSLQSLLERKVQVQVNLQTNQSFLSATDSSLSAVSGLLASVRGTALSVSDSTNSDEQRDAARAEVDQTIQQLVDTGNQQFRGRYLFSGTRTNVPAFEMVDGYVRYNGNEERLLSYSDIDILFETNIDGNQIFGALSEPVTGIVDLNPDVTTGTKLSDLRGGRGVSLGSIIVSDGTNTSTIDLSSAHTVGDIAEMLEAYAPEGRLITANVTSSGLEVSLDAGGGGTLTISEAGEGNTAAQLGILETTGVGVTTLVGNNLDPILTPTTRLSDIGGGGIDQAAGLQITNGDTTYTLDLSGDETVEDLLNSFNNSGASVLATINEFGSGIDVRSRLSGANFSIGENGGATAQDLGIRSFLGSTRLEGLNHGTGVNTVIGTDFVVRRRDGVELEFDVSSASTIEDVINLVNNHVDNQDPGTQVVAQLASIGNGIELTTTDTSTNATLAILKRGFSEAAEDLGLILPGADESDPPISSGGTTRLTGSDVNPLEVNGVFNSLIRLSDALRDNDQLEIGRTVEQLNDGALKVNFARADIGARQQTLDILDFRLQDEHVELTTALSEEVDVDLAAAISDFTARQVALQASLQTVAQAVQLSLLNFL